MEPTAGMIIEVNFIFYYSDFNRFYKQLEQFINTGRKDITSSVGIPIIFFRENYYILIFEGNKYVKLTRTLALSIVKKIKEYVDVNLNKFRSGKIK